MIQQCLECGMTIFPSHELTLTEQGLRHKATHEAIAGWRMCGPIVEVPRWMRTPERKRFAAFRSRMLGEKRPATFKEATNSAAAQSAEASLRFIDQMNAAFERMKTSAAQARVPISTRRLTP